MLETQASWLGKEDLDLSRKLLAELPGIFNWALNGHVYERHLEFRQPPSSAHLVEAMLDAASPVGAFARQRCVMGAEHRVEREKLHAAFGEWCMDTGNNDKMMDSSQFGIALSSIVPGLRDTRPYAPEGQLRPRYYVGINLKPRPEQPTKPAT